ncbi:alpha-L-rhamnosidase C-terminal domain-containing protein [Microbacterium sp. zg-YB36]|uniref:alpha-L-rhamnosidase-related protein n=1 Tax=Microbacterium sp. zg-YB36 TaxID=2969407 RepID=UPI00214CA839|nr:alpha-L-rhamnosidase C-terminal domain-containing protein [Microbacterium sp. zg-YB36]MDL5351812.1 alpha-L-rhamnosidase C-terminal domain-containing protein [Microbacterium sp. zg-YB36]
MLGRVQIVAAQRPVLTTGESEAEAAAGADAAESRCDLTETASGVYVTDHAIGFRYASVTGVVPESVTVHASIRPAPRRGAFLTDDPTLNTIWATSAHTLRLCMQTVLLEGIKRDRMPWMGDHALGVLTNAAAFADPEIIRTTLRGLGRPRDGFVNGISDYSLWWVISHGLYQRYFGDTEFARTEAEHLHACLTELATFADADGLFRPRRVAGSFPHAGPGAVFLDWGVQFRADGVPTAIQILWFWALSSAGSVLAVAEHPEAAPWTAAAAAVRAQLVARAWHPQSGLWSEYLDDPECSSAYPNFLAVLAGLELTPGADAVQLVSRSSAGTPFMRAFALMALGRTGERVAAVAEVRRLWSGMLDAGATTFWEDFGGDGSDLEMYGRPFGKSLCHAWSAGPAALLPELVLGIRPLTDGWRRSTVDPCLGALQWAAAVTPTPFGDVVVDARPDRLQVEVPAGTTLVHGAAEYPGPARVSIPALE